MLRQHPAREVWDQCGTCATQATLGNGDVQQPMVAHLAASGRQRWPPHCFQNPPPSATSRSRGDESASGWTIAEDARLLRRNATWLSTGRCACRHERCIRSSLQEPQRDSWSQLGLPPEIHTSSTHGSPTSTSARTTQQEVGRSSGPEGGKPKQTAFAPQETRRGDVRAYMWYAWANYCLGPWRPQRRHTSARAHTRLTLQRIVWQPPQSCATPFSSRLRATDSLCYNQV